MEASLLRISTASGRDRTIEGTLLRGGQPASTEEYLQQVAGIRTREVECLHQVADIYRNIEVTVLKDVILL